MLESDPLMWMLPLYLHVNKKYNDDDDDDVRGDLNEIRSLFSSRVTRRLDTLGKIIVDVEQREVLSTP